MRQIRIIAALFLTLWWVPGAGHCLISAAWPQDFGACCECHGEADNDHPAPAGDGACAQCVTLKSGANLAAVGAFAVPMPGLWEDDSPECLRQRLTEAAMREAAEWKHPAPSWIPPGPRAVMLTKARPVRGPSLAA